MSKQITIFEGPDGSGKTTAAKTFAEKQGAKYIHFPAMLDVSSDLPRMYIEAMLPALLGYQDVVMDRSWLSETPYSTVFRDGVSRLTKMDIAMIEMVAAKCQAVIILCEPNYQTMADTFKKRLSEGGEMLDNVAQHKRVCDMYKLLHMETSLPVTHFDYEVDSIGRLYIHRNSISTAGLNVSGSSKNRGGVFVVGNFMPITGNHDTLEKFPCVQFSHQLEPEWIFLLTELTYRYGVNVANVSWVDVSQPLDFIYGLEPHAIFGIGKEAYALLYKHKIMSTALPSVTELIKDDELIQSLVQAIKGLKL